MPLRPTLAIIIASLVAQHPAAAAPAIEPLIGFETGANSNGTTKPPMYLHPNGDFYGTTPIGGAGGNGMVFRMSQSGVMSGISFSAPLPGTTATGTPVLASDGWLWGTSSGPTTGTIFRTQPETGEVQSVYKFTSGSGVNPQAGLVSDGQGNFWGVTRLTNTANPSNNTNGVIFRINALTGAYTMAMAFPGSDTNYAQGRAPLATLYYDGAGNLWGGTSEGGTFASGIIFKYTISTNTLAVVTSFRSNNSQVGGTPGGGIDSPLVPDGNGFLWGVTPLGGASGYGTVFKVEMATNTVTSVLAFNNTVGNKGSFPIGPLVPDGAGSLWGVTRSGSQSDAGTVFKVATATGTLTTVQNLGFLTGANPPQNGLTADGKGYMWGIGAQGLTTSPWSVYKIKISDGTYTKVTETQPGIDTANAFVSNTGRTPLAGLAGNPSSTWLWGTTSAGGFSNAGTLFRYEPSSGKHEVIVNFIGQSAAAVGPSVAVGTKPSGQLCVDANGMVWGTTEKGGAFNVALNNKSQSGTIFKYDPTLGTFTTIFNFASATGESPKGGLTQMSDGFIWGTTSNGSSGSTAGTVFKINPATNAVTIVYNFNPATSSNGLYPECGLAEGPGGFVWGITKAGGANSSGVLFKIQISTSAFTVAGSLPSGNGNTVGNIAVDAAGNVWATNVTYVFKFTTATSTFTNVFTREASAKPRKGIFLGSITKTAAGNIRFLGTEEITFDLITNARGTARAVIYQIDPATNIVSKLQTLSEAGVDSFNTQDPNPKIDLLPAGGLYEHTDGRFYGLSQKGGTDDKLNPSGGGMIYRVSDGPAAMTQSYIQTETYSTNIFNQSLTLRGYVNPNGNATTCQFEWGATSALGNTVNASATPGTGYTGQICEATLTNLSPNTTYFFRLRANSTGAPSFGPILTVTTGAYLPVPTSAEISVESPLGQPLVDNVTTVNVGSHLVGRPYQQAVVVRNLSTGTGAGIVSGLSASISGPNAADFVISTPLAVNSLSSPQTSAGLTISFNASASGTRTAMLIITSNDADEGSFEVPLTGIGLNEPEIEVESPIAAALQSNVGIYDFGISGLTTNHSGIARTFTIRNTGNTALTGVNVTVTGANSAEFTVSAQPTSSITPGSSGTFSVIFAPTGEGIRNATLQIASNDSNENPFVIKITSLGILAPEIEMADGTSNLIAAVSTIDFGVVSVGSSVTKTITLSNVGSQTLTGISRQYIGSNTDFTATPPVTSLAAASQTTFTVTFTPQTTGLRTRTLRINSNDSDENPFDIFLTGGPPPLTPIQTWRQLWFLSPDNTGIGADNADSDSDGLKNLMEFALNTNPNIPNAPIFQTTITGGNIEFTYTRSKAAVNAGILFQVPWSEILNTATWNYADTVQTVLNDNGTIQTVKATVPMGTSGRRFVRIEVR
ncbi:MAG: choice-of-anchor tandem repeat GloVer-containing protein [Luteolibacter sp.]